VIVVSDTSAITSLIRIGREEILGAVCDEILIPVAVRDELLAFHASLPRFLTTVPIQNLTAAESLTSEIDRGEAEAIVLAQETLPDFVLLDDLAARGIAAQRRLRVIGLLGVLTLAKQQGFVSAVKPALIDLEVIAGFRIAPELRRRVLQACGEG